MAKCPGCGTENPEGYSFCAKCGAIVAGQSNLSDSVLAGPRLAITSAVTERRSSDTIVSPVLLVIAIFVVVMMTVVIFGVLFSTLDPDGFDTGPEDVALIVAVGIIGGIIYYGILGIITFQLVHRQNQHFARERRLREAVLELIRVATGTSEREALLSADIQSLRMIHASPEEEHSPWFWSFVVLFPLVIGTASFGLIAVSMTGDWVDAFDEFVASLVLIGALGLVFFVLNMYMFYFLGKNIYEHDRRWNQFVYGSRRVLTRLGLPSGRPYRVLALPERSFLVYLIVSLFISVFVYYWWYVLIKDPNEHFRCQWEYEDHLIDTLGRLGPTSPSSASPP